VVLIGVVLIDGNQPLKTQRWIFAHFLVLVLESSWLAGRPSETCASCIAGAKFYSLSGPDRNSNRKKKM